MVTSLDDTPRPLGRKAYGSIPHLPGSRTGPADKHLSLALARICTERLRDEKDHVVVLEKLDGSCVAAARLGDDIVALGREGRLAAHSPNEARQLWSAWVATHTERFLAVLQPGEWLVGEWLALAHGTRYALTHEPFVAFDLMHQGTRLPWAQLTSRVQAGGFITPGVIHKGGALDIDTAMARLPAGGFHHALDSVEGAVWRLERQDGEGVRVELLTKYVRRDKVDGSLLPENTGRPAIWNWRPSARPPKDVLP
ncbi:RNA ligase family protein [Myxococcus qinghaiensis]|uniref:RNA ligase family protein n=1 Tax=Myxococcus qinghaiensis TaxID=2906758 RepID=UPI0020A7C272|nr:RNA ligase family protein [Myxococcus qinghaiensis]MCP3164112.1 RNA ligase family protein [Myxococcus qinghaiensis]